MNRHQFVRLSAFALLAISGGESFVAALPEPTYTATLSTKQVVHLRLETSRAPDGRRSVRVWNQPKAVAKSDIEMDVSVVLGAGNKPLSSRSFFGLTPELGINLEAIRSSSGFTVREPALAGDLKFGSALFTPLLAELFIGRIYDFKRGGTQTFAQLFDTFVTRAKISTMTLTAVGKPETIVLPDGPVKARKLRYLSTEPSLPEAARTGVLYVGLRGEVLRCDTAFFGVPVRAKGPALVDNEGQRVTLRFANPDSPDRVVQLQGNRQSSGEWKIALRFDGQTDSLATLTCDASYRLKSLQTPWTGRPFTASVVGTDTLHWNRGGGPEQGAPVPAESPVWFVPHWFATDLWEGTGSAFAGMTTDETRDGFLLPLLPEQKEATPFTLERLAGITNGATGVRHYRFYIGGKEAAAGPRYDFYTDGSRLCVLLASDGTRIIRHGWESYAATLKPPV